MSTLGHKCQSFRGASATRKSSATAARPPLARSAVGAVAGLVAIQTRRRQPRCDGGPCRSSGSRLPRANDRTTAHAQLALDRSTRSHRPGGTRGSRPAASEQPKLGCARGAAPGHTATAAGERGPAKVASGSSTGIRRRPLLHHRRRVQPSRYNRPPSEVDR